MAIIKVNINKKVGVIKPLHGIGQPPLMGASTQFFGYLKDANIPYSRLHDVGGAFGGNLWVDIPNIFRDFDADETNPENYDFAFTDILIKGLLDNGCQPYFRLGVTIENFHNIKAFRIYPPKDMHKWARVCEHIIRHYNEGWANGFGYNIQYWEIWNEPDGDTLIENNAMWKGTKEEYFQLYLITSKHLRKCFGNTIKIGGYSSCGFYAIAEETDAKIGAIAFGQTGELSNWEVRSMGFLTFFQDFIKIVKEENLPWDFFAYHSYGSIQTNLIMQAYVEKIFQENGFNNTEIHLNEWNTNPRTTERGTLLASSNVLGLMCAMQSTKMQMMCYYDGRIGQAVYGGLFNPITYEPFYAYYALKAFGELYKISTQVECTSATKDIYALAAYNNGAGAVVITNNSNRQEKIILSGVVAKEVYIIGENKHLQKVAVCENEYTACAHESLFFII